MITGIAVPAKQPGALEVDFFFEVPLQLARNVAGPNTTKTYPA